MRVLVVGAGEMGRWFAATLDANLPAEQSVDLAFADVDEAAASEAADALGGRAVSTDTDQTFDLVCVAVPMQLAAETVAAYADRADSAVVDVAGAMAGPVDAMREHAPSLEGVSFHPLFSAANAPGNVAVVVAEPGPLTDRVRAALSAAGNDLFETTATEHDEAMETVQASAHAAVLAFGLAAADVREAFQTPISEGLFELLDQVTDGSPRVYADVQSTYEGADRVADAAADIAAADRETFADLYRAARPNAEE